MKQLEPPIEVDGKWHVLTVTETQRRSIHLYLQIYEDERCQQLIEERKLDIPCQYRDTVSELMSYTQVQSSPS